MPLAWFDALTPKQAKIAAVLFQEGIKHGIAILITTRRYRYVEETLRAYNVPYVVVGEYGEKLSDKLRAYVDRLSLLTDILPEFDIAVGFPSPEMHRVAFGLGKPIITLTDTAHAYHVSKLCLPLSTRVIVPEAIPLSELAKYIPEPELSKVRTFAGVFELMWVRRVAPDPSVPRRLGLRIGDYVIYRPEEEKAAYYSYTVSAEKQLEVIRILLEHGLQVVYMPRYEDQLQRVRSEFRREVEEGLIVIPEKTPLDLIHLEAFARLVITGGSTIALESALLGIPSVCYFPRPFYVDQYLVQKGFPLIRVYSIEELLHALPRIVQEMHVQSVQDLLRELEDPTMIIFEEILKLT